MLAMRDDAEGGHSAELDGNWWDNMVKCRSWKTLPARMVGYGHLFAGNGLIQKEIYRPHP